jgi:hypothetical protein
MSWENVPLTEQDREMATIAGLSDDEARFAKMTGSSFLRYAAMKDVRSADDLERADVEVARREQAVEAARLAEAQQKAAVALDGIAEARAREDAAAKSDADRFGLTAEEMAYAEKSGMPPAEYAAWKTVDNSNEAALVVQRAAEITQRAADINGKARAELAEVEAIMAEVEAQQAR